ncbi:MAG: hypothetical protein ACKV0T_00220 [Planctomycetales bacterium]
MSTTQSADGDRQTYVPLAQRGELLRDLATANASSDRPTSSQDSNIGESEPVLGSEVFLPFQAPGVLELVELILKDRPRLDRIVRDRTLATELAPRFLAVAIMGFLLFGVAVALVMSSFAVWPHWGGMPKVLEGTEPLVRFSHEVQGNGGLAPWLDGRGLKLIASYAFGLVAASGVCLPSLYFYSLLAGIRMTMVDVTIHTLKAKATSAVALVGILPIYVAISLGVSLLPRFGPIIEATLWLGMVLPFVAGLWGVRSLYLGFMRLAESNSSVLRLERRCFLSRLVLAWSACYTAVTPVMIFTVWQRLTG